MATEKKRSWRYINAAAAKKGALLCLGTVYGTVDLATAVTGTIIPVGVLLEDVAIGSVTPQPCGVGSTEGEVYKVFITAAAVAIGDPLGAAAAGAAVKVALSTTYANKWIFGIAISAASGTAGQIVEMRYSPQLTGQT